MISLALLFAHAVVIYCANVDYQIHSYNDLREWNQVILKGARRFKIDPHYLPASTCLEAGIEAKEGCLLLNHDKPVPSLGSYSSTDDLLSYLLSPEFATLTQDDHFTIALCFKDAPDKCNEESSAFNNWLKLVDNFYEQCITNIKTNHPNIDFILDGDAKPAGCLLSRWSEWKSVWIISDSETSSPAAAFQSDDPSQGYDRFQILNDKEDFSNWTWVVQEENYGKFAMSEYPIQLWEPDLQSDIQSYVNLYHSGERHEAGFHFAINIDIAMFDIYSGDSGSQRSVNNRVYPGGSRPLVSPLVGMKLDSSHSERAAGYFLLSYMNLKRNCDGCGDIMLDVLAYWDGKSSSDNENEEGPKVKAIYKAPVEIPFSKWLLESDAATQTRSLEGKTAGCRRVSNSGNALLSAIPLPTTIDSDAATNTQTPVLFVMTHGKMMYCETAFGPTDTVINNGKGEDAGINSGIIFGHTAIFEFSGRRLLDFVPISKETLKDMHYTISDESVSSSSELFFMLSMPETETETTDVESNTDTDQLVLSLVSVHADLASSFVLNVTILTEIVLINDIAPGDLTSARVAIVVDSNIYNNSSSSAGSGGSSKQAGAPSVFIACALDEKITGSVVNMRELLTLMQQDSFDNNNTTRMTMVKVAGIKSHRFFTLTTTAGMNTWVYLTVGTTVAVSAIDDAIMLFAGDGFCYNSHSHNTASLPTMCDQKPSSTPGVLEYSIGLSMDWLRLFSPDSPSIATVTATHSSRRHNTVLSSSDQGVVSFALGSCHQSILHGAYDQGMHPSIAMTRSRTNSMDDNSVSDGYAFIEVHEGVCSSATTTTIISNDKMANTANSTVRTHIPSSVPYSPAVTLADVRNGCGTPIAHDGVVIDSFQCVAWLDVLRIQSIP